MIKWLTDSNYLDRQNIASAKLAGITTDLGLSTTQYNTCVAVLFAGYVALQIPSNMLASKIPIPGICKFRQWRLTSKLVSSTDNPDKISAACAWPGGWSVLVLVPYTLTPVLLSVEWF